MKVDIELLEKLEKLSNLKVADEKREEIVSQLSEIVEYVNSLSELDTTNIDSYFSTIDGGTTLRDDVANCNKEISEDILKNAPQAEDNFFIVPAIIEGA
jgi:aspartyl-tRNA(Asn)/glutamyl-tRNA(Gln) amidotransferase subunit C